MSSKAVKQGKGEETQAGHALTGRKEGPKTAMLANRGKKWPGQVKGHNIRGAI